MPQTMIDHVKNQAIRYVELDVGFGNFDKSSLVVTVTNSIANNELVHCKVKAQAVGRNGTKSCHCVEATFKHMVLSTHKEKA